MEELGKEKAMLIRYVEQLDEEKVLKLANHLLNKGMEPLELLDLVNEGMKEVGKLYQSKDYYIADLIMAGLIFKQVLELDEVAAHFHDKKRENAGKILLGTVSGDIHDLGKDIFRGIVEASGFEVVDLGVDVSPDVFVEKFKEHKPDIVGLSGILTSTLDSMKETVDSFIKAGLRNRAKIIVGGNYLNADACEFIGADGFANDASIGVKMCLDWMKDRDEWRVTGND